MTTTRDPIDDAYARAFMGGDSVAFLDKVRAPWWLNATTMVAGGIGMWACIHEGNYVVAAAIGTLTTVMAGFLMELRTAVTNTHVHIQYGTFGPQVALADIAAVDVVDYEPLRYGGWGIRRGLNGAMAYSVPARGGKAVRLTLRSGRVVEVTSQQPGALRAAILQAQQASLSALEMARTRLDLRDAPAAPNTSAPEEAIHTPAASATTTKQR